jgi:AraC family transcriptional activator FtrA
VRAIPANPPGTGSGPKVAIVTYGGMSLFEFSIACQVFARDYSTETGVPWYRASICAAQPGPVRIDRGFDIQVPSGLAPLRRADTIVVTPTGSPDSVPDAMITAIRQAHRRGARVLSLCTGAFVLARAGLLDGRRATTHWADCEELRRAHPGLQVDADVLYVDDGDLLTSAGSAASMDLCLYVVRKDFGAEAASTIARRLVVPPHRDGGQAQYIDKPLTPAGGNDLFTATLTWMQENLDRSMTVGELAGRAAMSQRTFARRFAESVGTTPYQWLLRQRLALAQRLLEKTELPVEAVAERSGFVTAVNLRKHFQRTLHTSPQAYRRTFAA